jgi:hypothetical protein
MMEDVRRRRLVEEPLEMSKTDATKSEFNFPQSSSFRCNAASTASTTLNDEDESSLTSCDEMSVHLEVITLLPQQSNSTAGRAAMSITTTSSFRIIDGIGYGGMGTLVRAENTTSKDIIAMKLIPKNSVNSMSVLNELHVMKSIATMDNSCPFVQKFYDAYESHHNVFIIFEYISNGDICYQFSNAVAFSERHVRGILAELYLALEHVHLAGFVHGDIKVKEKSIYQSKNQSDGVCLFVVRAVGSLPSSHSHSHQSPFLHAYTCIYM